MQLYDLFLICKDCELIRLPGELARCLGAWPNVRAHDGLYESLEENEKQASTRAAALKHRVDKYQNSALLAVSCVTRFEKGNKNIIYDVDSCFAVEGGAKKTGTGTLVVHADDVSLFQTLCLDSLTEFVGVFPALGSLQL